MPEGEKDVERERLKEATTDKRKSGIAVEKRMTDFLTTKRNPDVLIEKTFP